MSIATAPNDPTYIGAVESLRRLFRGDPKPGKRSIREIYEANGRNLSEVEKNKIWLRDNMTSPRRHGLAEVIRSPLDDRTVEGVELTAEGKRALRAPAQRPEPRVQEASANPEGTSVLDRLFAALEVASKQYPQLNIELRINGQEGTGSVSG